MVDGWWLWWWKEASPREKSEGEGGCGRSSTREKKNERDGGCGGGSFTERDDGWLWW